jgi:hypothetical protein
MFKITKKGWLAIGIGGAAVGYIIWSEKKAMAATGSGGFASQPGTTPPATPPKQIQQQSNTPPPVNRETTETLPPGGINAVNQANKDGFAQGQTDGYPIGVANDPSVDPGNVMNSNVDARTNAYLATKTGPSGPGSAALGGAYNAGYLNGFKYGYDNGRAKSSSAPPVSKDSVATPATTPSGPTDAQLADARNLGQRDGESNGQNDANDGRDSNVNPLTTPYSDPALISAYTTAYNGAYAGAYATIIAGKAASSVGTSGFYNPHASSSWRHGVYVGNWWNKMPKHQYAAEYGIPQTNHRPSAFDRAALAQIAGR